MKNKFLATLLLFPTLFLQIALAQTEATIPYDRKLYHHWIDSDHNCIDTRSEILKSRSIIPVTMNEKGCRVVSGQWKDYYFDETLLVSTLIDIDHVVPLQNAHISGADKWDYKKRETFANDEENLVITNRRYNRQKGSKTIAEWLPLDIKYACKYVQDWIKIKRKYDLRFSLAEDKTIDTLNAKCK